jgi:molybdate transport system substrate-binding protein
VAAALVVSFLLGASLAGCGGDSGGRTQLTVLAAASLRETFGQLEESFEKDHPYVDVVISFGSSSALAEQINQGSPADVIATADDNSIGLVADDGNLEAAPTTFASNTLVVVTPPDNPAEISSVDDLAAADFVVCDPSAPCGSAAQTILDNSGVIATPKSLEADVKAVLTKVSLGEADAGIVYVTDARAAGDDLTSVEIAADVNVVNPYYIAAVKDTAHSDLAADWLSLVMSPTGQGVLAAAGFGMP